MPWKSGFTVVYESIACSAATVIIDADVGLEKQYPNHRKKQAATFP